MPNSCTKEKSTTLTEPASDDWALAGNSGVNTSTRFIGTTDTSAVAFRTNNSEVMRITKDGNVGIGTNNPQATLHVQGGTRISSLAFQGNSEDDTHFVGVLPDGSLATFNAGPVIEPTLCNNLALTWYNNTCVGANPNNIHKEPLEGNLGIGITDPSAKLDLVADENSTVPVLQIKDFNQNLFLKITNDGKVGIAESTPSEKLTVNGNIYAKAAILGKRSTGMLSICGNTGSDNGGTLELSGPSGNTGSEVHLIGKAIKFYDSPNSNQWELNMTINNLGNVGIGTDPSSARLQIKGSASDQSTAALQVNNSNDENLFTVRGNGQVGINWNFDQGHPQNIDYKLMVNGKIYTQGEQ
jgi:hypothetical protein